MDGAMADYQGRNYNWYIHYRTIEQRTEGAKSKPYWEIINQNGEAAQTRNITAETSTTRKSTSYPKEAKNRQEEHIPLQEQDEGETMCADDAALLITREIPEQFREKQENYAYVTKARNLIIRWGQVILITAKKENGISTLPEPRGKVEIISRAKIIGGKYA